MNCPTVRIVTSNGSCIINESDFDEKKHTIFDDSPKLEKAPAKVTVKKSTKKSGK